MSACSNERPQAPEVATSANTIAGVVWFDNGNGSIDDGELPGAELTVRLGAGNQLLNGDFTSTTDERGGFVLTGPTQEIADLFVEVILLSDTPDGGSVPVQHRASAQEGQINLQIPVEKPTACTSDVDLVDSEVTPCGRFLLPDLIPEVDSLPDNGPTTPIGTASVYVDTVTIDSRTLLRLASATANRGDGPLHVIPNSDAQDDVLQTWQRVWTDTNQFVDGNAGSFVFHPDHDHFHVADFEQYRLLTPDGQEVAVGEKISFCLIDSLPAVDNPVTRGLGVFLAVACQDAAEQQVLNVGWADYYGAGLPDQWIDITGVAAGEYLVEIVVDPGNLLVESNENNNRATFPITIDGEDLT